jgi:hypothetical protein
MMEIFLFTTVSRPVLGPIQPPIQWVLGVFMPGIKWLEPPPYSGMVKNAWSYTSTSPIYHQHGVQLRNGYIFMAWQLVKNRMCSWCGT